MSTKGPAFIGLFTSNPGGASGLSVWPRKDPVKRMSRSITEGSVSLSGKWLSGSYFAVIWLASVGKILDSMHTLSH